MSALVSPSATSSTTSCSRDVSGSGLTSVVRLYRGACDGRRWPVERRSRRLSHLVDSGARDAAGVAQPQPETHESGADGTPQRARWAVLGGTSQAGHAVGCELVPELGRRIHVMLLRGRLAFRETGSGSQVERWWSAGAATLFRGHAGCSFGPGSQHGIPHPRATRGGRRGPRDSPESGEAARAPRYPASSRERARLERPSDRRSVGRTTARHRGEDPAEVRLSAPPGARPRT